MLAALCVAPTTAFVAVAPHLSCASRWSHAARAAADKAGAAAACISCGDAAATCTAVQYSLLSNPNTKGGIVFYTIVLCALPFFLYSFMLDTLGFDVVLAGNVILVGYVGLGTVLWTSSYIFRVANKDMTYAQQLRDYENAVIQKRFEELSEDEVDALMGEICALAGSRPSHHA